MEIPSKLRQRGIKFVLLEKGGKKPFQLGWQNQIIEYDNPELIEHINNNGNYGVMGGGEKMLVIIDFDNLEVQERIVSKLPKTFSVKTGSGKLHKYFYSDKCESFKIFSEDMETLADIQGEGKQVVGAGSIHPNGKRYEVFDDSEIAFLPYSELRAIVLPFDKKIRKDKKEYEKPKGLLTDDFLDTLKNRVSIEDVLNSFGYNTSKNPTECPFHSSRGGKCFSFSYDVAHCFHCDGGWNIFSLVKDIKKCDFKEALIYLSNIAGLENELEESKRRFQENQKESEEYKQKEIRREFLELISGKDKKWDSATELLTNYIREKGKFYTTKDDIKSEVWVYKEGIYIPHGRSEIKKLLRNLLKQFYSMYIVNLVVAKIEVDTYINPDEFFKNNYPDEIPLKNGLLNLFTRELKSFTSEKIFFNKLPVTYVPNAKCPQIERFLNDILPDEDDKEVIYEIGGFCLYNEYLFEKAFMFIGIGRNGKDKTLELFKRVLGIENCASIPLIALQPDSFVISELFSKKVNLAGDISGQDLKDTSMFKALTGRSLISARRKFLNDITFVNYAKLIFACNDLPMVYDTSKGFWDRWVLLEFPFCFVTKDELDKAQNKGNLKLRDESIIERITTEEELSGLLNKFLDGLAKLMIQKGFSITKGTDEIKTLWIRKSNSFIAFCMDKLEEDYDKKISKKELRKKYSAYCKKHGIMTKSDFVVKRVLQENYGANEVQTHEGDRFWEGIRWKDEKVTGVT